jgi:hypothetical protein
MRKDGVYAFSNGDKAEGVFDDIVGGKSKGNYSYQYKSGKIAKP